MLEGGLELFVSISCGSTGSTFVGDTPLLGSALITTSEAAVEEEEEAEPAEEILVEDVLLGPAAAALLLPAAPVTGGLVVDMDDVLVLLEASELNVAS